MIICSSTDTHSPISIEAIKAGKHVFCEKPIDHDVDKIKEVIKTLEGTGLKYQVGFNRRFDHNFEAAQRAVVNGKIGAPHIIKITSRDPEPPSAEYVKVSGGMFLDMTIHDFDMVRFLAGCDAEEVYVQAANLVDPEIGKAGDVDTAIITLKMENGALAVIDNSRQAVYGYDQRAEVFGSKGMVAIKNDSDSTAVISNEDGVTGEKPQFFFLERYMDAYGKEMVQFIDAIENGQIKTKIGVVLTDKPEAMALERARKAGIPAVCVDRKKCSTKEEFEQYKSALKMVKEVGYGIAIPTLKDMKLDTPEVVKQGGRYGVKLKAVAPSIHMIRVDVESTFEPIIGSELQSKELINYLTKNQEESADSIWKSEIFGRSLDAIVQEGIQAKLSLMPDNLRYKLQSTLCKVVNKGSNNMIAIVL